MILLECMDFGLPSFCTPLNWCGCLKCINLLIRKRSPSWVIALVEACASWRPEGSWRRVIMPLSTCSRIKWQLTLICFVCLWKKVSNCNLNDTCIINMQWSGWWEWNALTPVTTHEAKEFQRKFKTDRYSASVDDIETWACFLHFHEAKGRSRNIHHLVVDHLVFGHLAQSASEYAFKVRGNWDGKKSPRPVVPVRYQMMHWTTTMCKCEVADIK